MTITDEILDNISKEIKIAQEVALFSYRAQKAKKEEREFFNKVTKSLIEQLDILNDSVASLAEKAGRKKQSIFTGEEIRIVTSLGKVTISKDEKKRFLESLQLEESALKKLRKIIKTESEETSAKKISAPEMHESAGGFTTFSSGLFSKTSLKFAEELKGLNLQKNLRRAGMPYLESTYFAMSFTAALLAFFAGIFIAVAYTFVSAKENLLISLAQNIGISLFLPVLVFILFLVYPSSQSSSISGKIENELPFAIMHMSTIAGSGVEPSKIFSIIALSDEYVFISREAKKVINLVNFYGYDLVTALREAAKNSPSPRLMDLLNGMASTITSGGNLSSYLNKNAQDSLLDYNLRRKSYVAVSETYADVYTGLLIAAPLIFMLMLALINIIGIGGLSASTLALIGIVGIAALNVGFLIFLQISQPES